MRFPEFGVPINVDTAGFSHVSDTVNHASARNYPVQVEQYLFTETSFNAMVGPMRDSPFEKL